MFLLGSSRSSSLLFSMSTNYTLKRDSSQMKERTWHVLEPHIASVPAKRLPHVADSSQTNTNPRDLMLVQAILSHLLQQQSAMVHGLS